MLNFYILFYNIYCNFSKVTVEVNLYRYKLNVSRFFFSRDVQIFLLWLTTHIRYPDKFILIIVNNCFTVASCLRWYSVKSDILNPGS